MTMKSVYIVYITNCFLWTMSDNKTHRIVSYRIVIIQSFFTLKGKSWSGPGRLSTCSDGWVSVHGG